MRVGVISEATVYEGAEVNQKSSVDGTASPSAAYGVSIHVSNDTVDLLA